MVGRSGRDEGERVLELGPGQGAITAGLLARFPQMTAVEIDERMVDHLREREDLQQLDLRQDDMLQLDFGEEAAARGGRLSLVSNTPFYLTSPLLFKTLGSLEHVESAVLTTQREVADKVRALAAAACSRRQMCSARAIAGELH